jgi:hypothetical protein
VACLVAAGLLLVSPLRADEIRGPAPTGAGSWMAPETNREDVRDGLRAGWDVIALGGELADREYREILRAADPGAAGRLVEPLVAGLRREMGRMFGHEMARTLDALTPEMVLTALAEARDGRPGLLCLEGYDLEVGVARYHHWVMLVIPRPHLDGLLLSWEFFERNVALPGTHEPYIRLRVRRDPPTILARMHWVGPGVRFMKVMGDRWVRSDAAGTRAYIEVDRRDGYIELRAEDGQSRARLHDAYLEVRSGAGLAWVRIAGGAWYD